MLVVISPAKKLDLSPSTQEPSTPQFQSQTNELAEYARALSVDDLRKLMGISEKLAALTHERFQNFAPQSTPDNAKPALFSFAGDTYTGLDAASLGADAIHYAQNHLRILSGLYGVLCPLDAIQPYRLEMGSRMKTPRGSSLYDFWGDQISRALNQQAQKVGTDILINCASQEYFRAVNPNALQMKTITPRFYEDRGGAPKMISFYAKKARGAMARYIIETRVNDAEQLQDFDAGGYIYDPDRSTPDSPAFLRQDSAA